MIRALLWITLLTTLAGCAQVKEYMGGDDNSEPPAELVKFAHTIQVDTLWSQDVGEGSKHMNLVPVVRNGKVYATDTEGQVSAYDAATGERIWLTETEAVVSAGPGVGDGLVMVGTKEAEVFALEAASGEQRWKTRVSSVVLAPPQAADGIVVVRSVDGRIVGLNVKDGKPLWHYDQSVPSLTLRGTSPPVLSGDMVLNGFDAGRLVGMERASGKLLWEARIATPRGRSELERMVDIDTAPLVLEDTVYVVTFQGRVAAVDLFSGRILWQRDMSSFAGIGIDASNLYITDERSHIWALDRFSSASIWKQEQMQARFLTAPTAIGNYVVAGDFEGYLHWMNREDGSLVGRIKVDSDGISAPAVVDGNTLYVYGNSGKLVALRPGS